MGYSFIGWEWGGVYGDLFQNDKKFDLEISWELWVEQNLDIHTEVYVRDQRVYLFNVNTYIY